MNQQEQEFLQTFRQCLKMNWIQSKQMYNLKIFFTGTNCFYQRRDIIFDYLLPLNSQQDDREWRRQHRINRLSAKQFPEFSGILQIVGESKCGRQVVYIKQSKLQPDKIDFERYKQYFLGFLEDVCRSCKGFVDSYITILDVDEFCFSNFDFQMTKSLLNMVLQFFPERQNKVFIINMSGFVMGCYNMLKPFCLLEQMIKQIIKFIQTYLFGKKQIRNIKDINLISWIQYKH